MSEIFKDVVDKCRHIGCPGLCCKKPHMYINELQFERTYPGVKIQPENANLDDPGQPAERAKRTGYRTHDNFFELIEYKSDADCRYLLPEGGCSNYQNRPEACKSTEFGGEKCSESRIEAGLQTVAQIMIQLKDIK